MGPIRHRTVAEALAVLMNTNRRASRPLAKTISSAFANARRVDPTLGPEQVVISRLTADGGPVWKRFRAAAFGRAVSIHKRTTHVTVELDRKNGQRLAGASPPGRRQQVARVDRGRGAEGRQQQEKPVSAHGPKG